MDREVKPDAKELVTFDTELKALVVVALTRDIPPLPIPKNPSIGPLIKPSFGYS